MPRKHSVKEHRRRKTPWVWITLGVIFIALVAYLIIQNIILNRARNAPPVLTAAAVEISPDQAYEKWQQGVFFLDVRTQEEWNEFHLEGSTLIPLDTLSDRLNELPQDGEIVVVCRSGHRSASAADILVQAGFKQVSSLKGGLSAWKAAGYPVEGSNK